MLASDQAYAGLAKLRIDWDSKAARAGAGEHAPGTPRARRPRAARSSQAVAEAIRLLAAVVGQHLEQPATAASGSPTWSAGDPVISAVEPDARLASRAARGALRATRGASSLDPTAR